MNTKQIKIRNTIAKFVKENKLFDAVKWLVEQHPHSFFVMVKKDYCAELLNDILSKTKFLDDSFDLCTRIWHYLIEAGNH